MVSEDSKKMKLFKFLILAVVIGLATLVLPKTIGLSRGGFDTTFILQQYSFYLDGVILLILLTFIFLIQLIITKDDSKYGDSIFFASQGDFPALPFFKRFSLLQIAWLSIIVFGALAMGAFLTTQTTFTGVTVLEQQFTPLDSILFSSTLIPGSENLQIHFIGAVGILFLALLARRFKITKENYRIFAYVILIVLFGAFGGANHLLRYGGSDINIIKVIAFWAFGGFITALTGTFIPFWIMHITNNLFFDLARTFTNESIFVASLVVLILLTITYGVVYRERIFGKRGGVKIQNV